MTEPVVRVRGLRKTYGERVAVADVEFHIDAGETFALLGPNGAGKSTTIEILEGYRDRTSGEVSVLGTDPQHGGLAWKARLGMVLQTSGETGTATVREQVRHFAGLYPNPRDPDELIEAVGLAEQAGSQVRRLSGGQRRRVDVALGIVGRPELLFLDEPTTGFDPEARHRFWDLIRGLQEEGTSILLTTHYLDEAAQLAGRVGVIADGRMIETGSVDGIGGAAARIPIVRWQEDDRPREERTDHPGLLVARLVAANDGAEPEGLEVIRPSLEAIYLDLVAASAAGDPAALATASATPRRDDRAENEGVRA